MERIVYLESNLKSYIVTLKRNKKSKYDLYKLVISQTVSTRDRKCFGGCQSILLDRESIQKLCDDLKANNFQKVKKTTKEFCQYKLKDVTNGDENLVLIYPLEFNCEMIPFFELFISEQKYTDQIELVFVDEKYTYIPKDDDAGDINIYKNKKKIDDWVEKNKDIWKRIKEAQPDRRVIPYYLPQPQYPYYPPMTPTAPVVPTSPYFDHKFYCTYSGNTNTYFF